jgi:hypothetical protein
VTRPRRHEWEVDASPGIILWRCLYCGDKHMLSSISAANPERLRSMLVILEATSCR